MANPQFQLKVDTSQLERSVDDHVNRQLPFAIARALNETANAMKSALREEMQRSFDRPTPYTLNALYVQRATKQKLVAQVSYKDATSKGTPAAKYLSPEVEGGGRSVKRFERSLTSNVSRIAEMMSRLGVTNYFVPGMGAQLDGYGNMARGQFSKILSQLGGQNDRYANETKRSRDRREGKEVGPRKVRSRAGPRYFVAGLYRARRLAPGIWIRIPFAQGWAIRPVLLEAKSAPSYAPRFEFYEMAAQVFDETAPLAMQKALTYALKTAR
jgi:hypothetical protein